MHDKFCDILRAVSLLLKQPIYIFQNKWIHVSLSIELEFFFNLPYCSRTVLLEKKKRNRKMRFAKNTYKIGLFLN